MNDYPVAREGVLYKDSMFEYWLALAFMIVPPIVGPLNIIYKLQTGQTILIKNRMDFSPHVASQTEIYTMIFAPLVLSFFGYLVLRAWQPTGIRFTKQGITKIRIGGQTSTIPWDEVDHVNRYVTTKGVGSLNIVGKGRMIALDEKQAIKNGLDKVIPLYLPHIDFSPWKPSKLICR